jgi:hypothetical protein
MFPHATLTDTAEELFEQEWQRRLTAVAADRPGAASRDLRNIDQTLALGLLRELIDLLETQHERPVRHLVPTIRLLILEHDFIDDGGDQSAERSLQQRVDELVELYVGLLEQVRQRAITSGEWSDLPATPQMFG